MTHPAPTLTLVDNDPAELAVDAIVIGLHSQPDEGGTLLPAAGAESIAAAFDGKLTSTLALLGGWPQARMVLCGADPELSMPVPPVA